MRAVHEKSARGRKLGEKNSRFTVMALYHGTVERLHAWVCDIYLVPESMFVQKSPSYIPYPKGPST